MTSARGGAATAAAASTVQPAANAASTGSGRRSARRSAGQDGSTAAAGTAAPGTAEGAAAEGAAAEAGAAQAASSPEAPDLPVTATSPLVAQVAAAVQAIEVVGILIATVLAAIDVAHHKAYIAASGIAITAIGAGAVLALGFVAYGLYRMRRWSRTPALLTQLFVGIVGIYLVQAPRLDWGIPALVLSVTGFAALLSPAGIRTLAPGRREA